MTFFARLFHGPARLIFSKAITALLCAAAAFSLTVLSGCGGGGGGGGGGVGGNGGGAQNSTVTGTLMSQVTNQALSGITVAIQGTNLSGVSNSSGQFSISGVPVGQQTLDFSDAAGDQEATSPFAITGPNDSLGTLTLNIEGNPPSQPGI